MPASAEALRDVVVANRILAHEGVVDAFGHVSIRHPDNAEHYLLSCARAPELIEASDIVEYTQDGEALDLGDRRSYSERMIHGAIYEARPDVTAVVHNHSYEVIPFAVTDAKLRPVTHTCAPIGIDIPVWDIRDKFGETHHLVVTMEQGRDLAACLGDRSVALMKRHGCVVVGSTLQEAVMKAVYLQVNAKLQLQAMQIGTPDYLTAREVELCTDMQQSPISLDRAWEMWCRRAGAK
jgi:ribulose-5-phosphate 4-epimerase/fuculose-1-phosphate aldolase